GGHCAGLHGRGMGGHQGHVRRPPGSGGRAGRPRQAQERIGRPLLMRILIRTSKWAIWARRFGSLAVPLTVIPVFLHRERLISSADFTVVEIVALAVAGLGLFLALGAFARLWVTGDQGWGKATIGFFLSLVCLAPFAFTLMQMTLYPAVSDVSTDPARPPGLVSQIETRPLTIAARDAIEAAFPNARSRTYPIEAAQMFALVESLVDE